MVEPTSRLRRLVSGCGLTSQKAHGQRKSLTVAAGFCGLSVRPCQLAEQSRGSFLPSLRQRKHEQRAAAGEPFGFRPDLWEEAGDGGTPADRHGDVLFVVDGISDG